MLPLQNVLSLVVLYMLEGIPFGFQIQVMPLLFRQRGYRLWQISLIHSLSLPWLLKCLVAPLLGNSLSNQTHWICSCFLAVGISFAVMSFLSTGSMLATCVLLFLNSLFSAALDIAVDGLAIKWTTKKDVGMYCVGVLAMSLYITTKPDRSQKNRVMSGY